MKKSNSITIDNRSARYNYTVIRTVECGISLWGNEVKSLRSGLVSIKEAWITIRDGDLYIKKMHITPYEQTNRFDAEPDRDRKLLAHRSEIDGLARAKYTDGCTLIPLKIYFNTKGKAKVLVGVCKGRKAYDKRQYQMKRDADIEIKRALKNRK